MRKIVLAVTALVFLMAGTALGAIEDLCSELNLPYEVGIIVWWAGDLVPPHEASYFLITVSGGTVLDGQYNSYCANSHLTIRPPEPANRRGIPLMAAVYSSYDCSSIPAQTPPLIEDCTNIGKVNWIVNNVEVGDESSCDGTYTYGDIQLAIWELLEDEPELSGLGPWERCRVDEIKANAEEDYVPGCGDVLVVILLPYVYVVYEPVDSEDPDSELIPVTVVDPDTGYPEYDEADLPENAVLYYVQPVFVTISEACCRFTGGGVDSEMEHNGAGKLPAGIDRATFGGQVGANTALPPQPKGEWTHTQHKGPSGSFTFHGGTASAPAGTEIIEIRCSDPGGCKPSGDPPSPVKQLDFDGIGTFKNFGKAGTDREPTWLIDGANASCGSAGGKFRFDGTFHYFQVNVDDLGEPGNKSLDAASNPDICPPLGFGEKGAPGDDLGDCRCADFYRITIYDGVDAADLTFLADGSIDPALWDDKAVIYEFYGYIDGGNLQIHHPTGYDRKLTYSDLVNLSLLAANWLEDV